MKVARSIDEMHAALEPERCSGKTIGFVPTMGALHEGHLSLVRAARDSCDVVVMSIFVNPSQFLPTEDLGNYPRTEDKDLELAEIEKVDVVFVPTEAEMYPPGSTTTVHVRGVTEHFEGTARPGHFDGVATVVAKLFGLVQPHVAFFGQKDAQQLAVVRRMVRDLALPVRIEGRPTVREPDGLAMSSRNVYLSPEERAAATVLSRALEAGARELKGGGSPGDARRVMEELVTAEPLAELDHADVVDPDSFGDPTGASRLLIIAAHLGRTRLIDNRLT